MYAMDIIEDVEAERIRRGLSVPEMAKSVGMAYATYYHWLEGMTSPKLSQLMKVMDKLGLTLTVNRRA